MKIYYKRQSDSPNVMVNPVVYLEPLHKRILNQNRMMHIYSNPDITIQTLNRLDMLLEYDPKTIK